MKKNIALLVFALVAFIYLPAQTFNSDKANYVIEKLSSGSTPSDATLNTAFEQSEAVVKIFENSVDKIKVLNDKKAREAEADRYNSMYKTEYNAFKRITKLLRNLDDEGKLPLKYQSRLKKLRQREKNINSWYTKFRSGYDI